MEKVIYEEDKPEQACYFVKVIINTHRPEVETVIRTIQTNLAKGTKLLAQIDEEICLVDFLSYVLEDDLDLEEVPYIGNWAVATVRPHQIKQMVALLIKETRLLKK